MWPFGNQKNNNEKSELDIELDKIDVLSEIYPLGSTFEYVGVKCIVTMHSTVVNSLYGAEVRARLFADYVDVNGVIRELALSYGEAVRLSARSIVAVEESKTKESKKNE